MTDKPQGRTSCWAVSKVKRLVGEKKAGHAGTLDPLATGVLVMGLGLGTRVLKYVESFDKEYTGEMQLGVATETDDAEGRVTETRGVPDISGEVWASTLRSFTGKLTQTPPCYSAVKIGGERAYDKARRGESFEIKPREVTVYALELIRWDGVKKSATLRVRCSKGTYIRSLARDIGKVLGCGAHLTALRRDRIGPFTLAQAVPLHDENAAELARKAVMPLESALGNLAVVQVGDEDEARLLRGQPIEMAASSLDRGRDILIRDKTGAPLCLGQIAVSEVEGSVWFWPNRMLRGL